MCGTCVTPVLAGEPDHRDAVLSAQEKAANCSMCLCVSRAKSAALVLDLDMRVLDDVAALFDEEMPRLRSSAAVMGVAPDTQTLYLIAGMGPGYNGGVQLLDLDRMRASRAYNGFLAALPAPAPHHRDVGDSTLLTMLNVTAPELVHPLPCGWHVTLSTHWQEAAPAESAAWPAQHPRLCAGVRVRIVHGKGLGSGPRGPVLKGAVNVWLRNSAAVLAFSSARPVDGGTGALYVLLGRD